MIVSFNTFFTFLHTLNPFLIKKFLHLLQKPFSLSILFFPSASLIIQLLIIHHNGKCAVKNGGYDKLKPICEALLEQGLTAKIE